MAKADEFAEKLGATLAEMLLWPPMAGRISASLMSSQEPLTLEQLQELLGASGGSVSETTRMLVGVGVVQRLKEPGIRRSRYEWAPDAWINCSRHLADQMHGLHELARSTAAAAADSTHVRAHRLTQMAEYYEFMATGVANLAERYEAAVLARLLPSEGRPPAP